MAFPQSISAIVPVGINLSPAQDIRAKAGTGSVINYTITGGSTVDSSSIVPSVIAQGQVGTGVGILFTSPANTYTLIQSIALANISASPVTGIIFYINGALAANQINGGFTIPANGSANYANGIWQILGADGIVLTTIGGAAGGDLTGSYPNPTLAAIGAATGPIGSASVTPIVTIDAKGRVTALSSATITPSAIGAVPTARNINTTAPLTGGGALSGDLTLAIDPATFAVKGALTAAEKIELNSINGQTSAGASVRVFRPGDYMVGNNYDPTGAVNSTPAFQAMMTAIRAFNDRCCIQLTPGVFKIDHDVLTLFGTNNPSFSIIGPGRGCCILLPNAAPTGFQSMITCNTGTTGGDSITMRGFTIYNTSGTVYTAGSGILTNGADAIDISEIAFIDLYRDIQVSGAPYTMVTNGTVNLTGISPAITAAINGSPVSGAGITPGTTITFVTSSTATLSAAANNSTSEPRFIGNSIKVSMQKIVSFNTNAGASNTSVGIYVNNGQAGDTYMGPDIVMSDGGGTTRRRACIEIVESGHYEIVQANLTGSQRGLLIDPGTSQSVAFGFHTNILCDSNTINGCVLNAVTTATIKNIKSVNSWYSGTTVVNSSAAAAGFLTTGAGAINGITHTTDRFLNNRTHGYEHTAGTDFRWSDCDMKGNNSANASGTAVPAAGNSGLSVAANIGNWSINGGKFGGTDTVPTAGNQEWGILVAAGTGNNIKISPDDVSGNRLGPIAMGATGANVFINGCPGLAAPYVRGVSGGTLAATQVTVAVTQIPKNSSRISTSFRLICSFQQAAAITAGNYQVRCGTTADTVGTNATNAIVCVAQSATGAANGWGWVEFIVTITVLSATVGNIQGSGQGALSTTAASGVQAGFGSQANARAANAGFLATINTTADLYLSLSMACTASTLTPHNSSIEVLNY